MTSESSQKTDSYKRILKSSSIMGGSSAVNFMIGMVRTKFVAVLIGTGGVGLLSNYTALQGLISTLSGLGIQSSAVRDVATAVAENDELTIGRTILTLRRMSWITGLLGASVMMILSPHLSQWTFGSKKYSLDIAMLGICILLGNVSGGQMALIQGMRRIADMARINVYGTAAGSVIAIAFYFWLGVKGIVPALLAIASVNFLVTWFYASRIPFYKANMSIFESIHHARSLMKLGFVFMWNGLLAGIVAYAINALIIKKIGLSAMGMYSAAFALSGMLVNFVLNAMTADYYPGLVEVAHDKEAVNSMVNNQTEIGLLLVVPGILATISLAPWIIKVFYTDEFMLAASLLQWFVLGTLMMVISWPLGIVMQALGKSRPLIMIETVSHALHLILVGLGLFYFRIEGSAIAFFLLYLFHIIAMYAIGRQLTGFCWSVTSRKLLLTLLPVVFVNFFVARLFPNWLGMSFGLLSTIFASIFCLNGLVTRIGPENRLSLKLVRIQGKMSKLVYDLRKLSKRTS